MTAKKSVTKSVADTFLQTATSRTEIREPTRTGFGTWLLIVFVSLLVGVAGAVLVQQPWLRALAPWLVFDNNISGEKRLVVEKREQVETPQEEVWRRLLADARGRVVRVMKGDKLVSIATLVAEDSTSSWLASARPWETGTTVVTADGRVLVVRGSATDPFTGLTFMQTDLLANRAYETAVGGWANLSASAGTTIAWLAPQDAFGAPVIEVQSIRGLYGGADQQGFFPLAKAARRLDTASAGPLPGAPAVNLSGKLIGIADNSGGLIPINAVLAGWRLRQNPAAVTFSKFTARYYPFVSPDDDQLVFKLVKKDGTTLTLPTAAFASAPGVGDDLMEIIMTGLAEQAPAMTALHNIIIQFEASVKKK